MEFEPMSSAMPVLFPVLHMSGLDLVVPNLTVYSQIWVYSIKLKEDLNLS